MGEGAVEWAVEGAAVVAVVVAAAAAAVVVVVVVALSVASSSSSSSSSSCVWCVEVSAIEGVYRSTAAMAAAVLCERYSTWGEGVRV